MADTSSTTHESGALSAPELHTSDTDNATREGELASPANNANETPESVETTSPPLAHEVPGTIDNAQANGTDACPPEHQAIEPASTGSKAGEEANGGNGTVELDHSREKEEDKDSLQDELKEDLLDLAWRAGSADDIRKCLQQGADILATNEGGETALHIAARSNHAENLQILLEFYVWRGLDINIKDDDGWTPLYGAAPYDSKNLISTILEVKGVDLREQIPSGETPLYRACSHGNIVGVKLMLAKAKELGYNIIDIANNDGWTPLHAACAEGEVETVRVLLNNHAKSDGKDKIGQTALHVASIADRDETVAFLLSKPEGHTLIDLTDANKQTALHLASERDNLDTVKVLVQARALLDISDLDGHTPLHLCAREGYDDVVKVLLLEAKPAASVNARTKMDETALQLAGRGQEDGHFKAIKLLSGALPPQSRKKTLLNFCGLEEYDALTRLLLHLNWEGLEPEEENIKTRANMIWKAAHPYYHDNLRQALIKKAKAALQADLSKPDMPLTSSNIEELGALQWAAYLGDYLIVWWLLYSVRRGKELEDDRAQAFNIASWCKKQLVKQDHEKNDEINVPRNSRPMSRLSKENPGLAPHTAKSLSVHLPAHSGDGFLAPLGRSQLGLQQFDTSASDYENIIDLLRDNVDPPLLPGWSETDNLFPKPTVDEISKLRPLTEQFDANIVDFYRKKDSRLNFLRRTRSVWEVVYAEEPKVISTKKSDPNTTSTPQDSPNYGPSKIMNHARSKVREIGSSPGSVKQIAYTENDLQFRWIHLPANNLEWMIDLTRRICNEGKKTRDDKLQISEFIRQSIQELPGTRPCMNPISIKEPVQSDKNAAKKDKEAESQRDLEGAPGAARSGQEKVPIGKEDAQIPAGTEGAKSPDPRCSKLALYMPYLTFATFTTPEKEKPEKMPEGNELEDPKLLTKNEQLSAAYHIEKVPNQVRRASSKNDARQDWKKLHESRTLDQFYYRSLIETEDRDETQVVTRYIDKTDWRAPLEPGKQLDILRVDQLWLWVIDETTIISSSTHRLDQRDDPVLEGIFNNLREAKGKSKGQPPPSSVDEMSKFITTFCIDQIDKDRSTSNNEDLSARQIFANTVNDAAIREAKLFQRFDDKITKKLRKLETRRPVKNGKARSTQKKFSTPQDEQKKSEQEQDYESISKATRLLVEVKDIRDELNILNYLLCQQKVVWRQLLGLRLNDDGTVNMNGISPKEIERWKGPGLALKEVEEMDKIAQRIQDSVNSVLGLEQNEANISEAEETRRQGDTLMVFTIITIVFLPMSFLASLFALNVTTFPHEGDNLVYEPKFIFSIIFSITAVISIPTIIFAGKKFFLRHWDKVRKYCSLHWQTIEDHFQRIIDVLSNDDGGRGGGNGPGGSSHNVLDKKALEKITVVEAPKKAKTEQKSVSQPKSDEQPTITITAPDSDKSSLQKPPSGKEIAASSSREVGEKQLKEGEIEDSQGTGEGIWKFFTHPFSNHSAHPNRHPDIEQALKN